MKKAAFFSLMTIIIFGSLFFFLQIFAAQQAGATYQTTSFTQKTAVLSHLANIATTYEQILGISRIHMRGNQTNVSIFIWGNITDSSHSTELSNWQNYMEDEFEQLVGWNFSFADLSNEIIIDPLGVVLDPRPNEFLLTHQDDSIIEEIFLEIRTDETISNTHNSLANDAGAPLIRVSVIDSTGGVDSFTYRLDPTQNNNDYKFEYAAGNISVSFGTHGTHGDGTLLVTPDTAINMNITRMELIYQRSTRAHVRGQGMVTITSDEAEDFFLLLAQG